MFIYFQEWRHRSQVLPVGYEIRFNNKATSSRTYKTRQMGKCLWRKGQGVSEMLLTLLSRGVFYHRIYISSSARNELKCA